MPSPITVGVMDTRENRFFTEKEFREFIEKRNKSWWKALKKAESSDAKIFPLLAVPNQWAIIGSNSAGVYLVSRTQPNATRYYCQCPAGQRHNPCWHAAKIASLPSEKAIREKYREELVVKNRLAEEKWIEEQALNNKLDLWGDAPTTFLAEDIANSSTVVGRLEMLKMLERQTEEAVATLGRVRQTLEDSGLETQ